MFNQATGGGRGSSACKLVLTPGVDSWEMPPPPSDSDSDWDSDTDDNNTDTQACRTRGSRHIRRHDSQLVPEESDEYGSNTSMPLVAS